MLSKYYHKLMIIQVSFVIHYIRVKLKGAKLMVTSGINGVQIQTDPN